MFTVVSKFFVATTGFINKVQVEHNWLMLCILFVIPPRNLVSQCRPLVILCMQNKTWNHGMVRILNNISNIFVSRDLSIDAARGIAVLLMVEAHIPIAFGMFQWIAGWLAAPFFLMIAGMSYEMFISARPKAKIESISRAIMLYLITFIGEFLGSVLWPEHYRFALWNWTVFQVIAVGYIIGILLPRSFRSRLLQLSGLLILFYLVNKFDIPQFYLLTTGGFPPLPFMASFLFGRVIQDIYILISPIISIKRCLFTLILMIISVQFIHDILWQYRVFITPFLLLILMYMLRNMDGNRFFSISSEVGKIAFTAYYSHMLIIYIIFRAIFINPTRLSLYWNPIVLLLIAILMSKLESSWRKHNYIFSVEWAFRQGSNHITNIISRSNLGLSKQPEN